MKFGNTATSLDKMLFMPATSMTPEGYKSMGYLVLSLIPETDDEENLLEEMEKVHGPEWMRALIVARTDEPESAFILLVEAKR